MICSSDRRPRKKQSACKQNRHVYTALTSVGLCVPFICAWLCVLSGASKRCGLDLFFSASFSATAQAKRRASIASPPPRALAKDKKICSKGSKQWKERHRLGFETTKGTRSNHPAFILINVETEKPTKTMPREPSFRVLAYGEAFAFWPRTCWYGVSMLILLCSYNCFFIL